MWNLGASWRMRSTLLSFHPLSPQTQLPVLLPWGGALLGNTAQLHMDHILEAGISQFGRLPWEYMWGSCEASLTWDVTGPIFNINAQVQSQLLLCHNGLRICFTNDGQLVWLLSILLSQISTQNSWPWHGKPAWTDPCFSSSRIFCNSHLERGGL